MDQDRLRPIRVWLYVLAALVFAMVVVGGATRLTGSGLSITEWRPVTGAVPPLSVGAWEAEFAKYREIPQYRQLNAGMSLDEFKTIYWWEWGHRFLGRILGLVFAVPLVVFVAMGRIGSRLLASLLGLLALGGAQAFVGWFMVQSGLSERVSVSQYRLAFHLTLALVIFSGTLWIVRGLAEQPRYQDVPPRMRLTAQGLLGLVFLQIFLGALVAGLDAGLGYQTWPLMDGRLVPPLASLLAAEPAWTNFFENILTVQFQHRLVAYLLLAVAALHAWDGWRGDRAVRARASYLFALVALQGVLGVLTLLNAVPIGLALAHQAGAVAILGLATIHAHALRRSPERRPLAAPVPIPA